MSDKSGSDTDALWEPGKCPRCGANVWRSTVPTRGRRQIWCSSNCRRAAHAERVAAERAGTAIRVVEVPRAVVRVPQAPVVAALQPTSEEAAAQVLSDTAALAKVLRSLTAQARRKKLDRTVFDAARELARAVLPNALRR
jgi:hypothetical protein